MSENAEQFCNALFKCYFQDVDFSRLQNFLDEDVVWIERGEMKKNFNGVRALQSKHKTALSSVSFKARNALTEVRGDKIFMIGKLSLGKTDEENHKGAYVTLVLKNHFDTYKLSYIHLSYGEKAPRITKDVLDAQEKTLAYKRLNSHIDALINGIEGGVIICQADKNFKILQHNGGFAELMGGKETDFVNKNFSDYIDGKDVSEMTQKISNTLHNLGVFNGEYRVRRSDGEVIWVRDKSTMLVGYKNSNVLLSVLTEVTEKRKEKLLLSRTLEEMKLSEEKNRILTKRAGFVTFDYDIVCDRLMFSPEMRARCNLPTSLENGVESMVAFGLIDKTSAEEFRNVFRLAQKGKVSVTAQIKINYPDGSVSPTEITLQTIFNDLEEPVRAVGFLVDKNFDEIKREKERQYYEMLSVNPIINFVADIDLDKLITFSHDWLKQAGKKVEFQFSQLVENLSVERIHPADRQKFLQTFNPSNLANFYAEGKNKIQFEYRRSMSPSESVWVLATVDLVRDKLTSRLLAYVNAKDIHEEKLRALKLAEEHKYYLAMLNKAAMIYEIDYSGDCILGGNEFWEEKFGIKAELNYSEAIQKFSEVAVHPKDAPRFRDAFLLKNVLSAYHSGKNEITCEYRRLCGDKTYEWILCSSHFMEGSSKNDIKGFTYAQIITNKKELENNLMRKAQHDVLTNLFNKSYCNEQIIKCLNQNHERKVLHAFIIIDVDNFKNINDTCGHLEGDAALVKVGEIMSATFRKSDILGRIGGDEFAVFMKDIDDKQIAVKKCGEILHKLEKVRVGTMQEQTVGASVGIAFYSDDGETFNQLYANADKAMYQSKRNGKGKITLYENIKNALK